MANRRNSTGDRFWTAAATLAVVAALIVCALAARRLILDRNEAAARDASRQARQINNWRYLVRLGHTIGQPGAPIRIVEFADFQCPACARAEPQLENALRYATVPFRIAFVHFPLTAIHPEAFLAAVASECAAHQGHFEAIHNVLYSQQRALGKLSWTAFASDAGVEDSVSFENCLRDSVTANAVQLQSAVAAKMGLTGTPTFVVDGMLYPAGTPLEVILAAEASDAQRAARAKAR